MSVKQIIKDLDKLKIPRVKLTYSDIVPANERHKIISSYECAQLLMTHYDPETIQLREEFQLLLMNRTNRVLGVYQVSTGSSIAAFVCAKAIIQTALLCNATSIIVSHNHPSGNTKPSDADIKVTRKLKHALEPLEITLLDHIIVTADGNYYSFADNGDL